MRSGPHAVLRLPDGREVVARPGDLVGRTNRAAVQVIHPSISEAHALVSLRGRALVLLALRGRLRGEDTADELPMQAGLRVWLSREVWLDVVDVAVPDEVDALEGLVPSRVELTATVHALRLEPPGVLTGFDPGAPAHLWDGGSGWVFGTAAGVPRPVMVDIPWTWGGATLVLRRIRRVTSLPPTDRTAQFRPPLRCTARYESVHLSLGNDKVVLTGLPARLVTEVIRFDAPVPWEWVARALWPEPGLSPHTLRRRWDRVRERVRVAARSLGLSDDLIAADGNGNVELVTSPGDEVVDLS